MSVATPEATDWPWPAAGPPPAVPDPETGCVCTCHIDGVIHDGPCVCEPGFVGPE